jgi:hypothetical protein
MNKIQYTLLAFLLLAIASQSSIGYFDQPINIQNCPEAQCIKCGTNERIDPKTKKCVCNSGLYLVNGVCSQCALGEVYSPYTQWCTKKNACGPNEVYSYLNQRCECLPGLIYIYGRCSICPPN